MTMSVAVPARSGTSRRSTERRSIGGRMSRLGLGIFFLSACLVVTVNLAVDVVYGFLDPRIRTA